MKELYFTFVFTALLPVLLLSGPHKPHLKEQRVLLSVEDCPLYVPTKLTDF